MADVIPTQDETTQCRWFAKALRRPALYLSSGLQEGVHNMVWDEFLLEWVRTQDSPTLVIRLYGWQEPTWSLGVHQSFEGFLKQVPTGPWVRRPTGGRAIGHGADISFAFVTNLPLVLNQSISESYCIFSTWIRGCLDTWGLVLSPCSTATVRDYTRSSLCFETALPTDLKDATGKKRVGAAQLRRHGGLLQHGSIFLEPNRVSSGDGLAETYGAFEEVFQRFFQTQGLPLLPITEEGFVAQLSAEERSVLFGLEQTYRNSASGILASTSKT